MRAEDRRKLLTPNAEPAPEGQGLGCELWVAGLFLVSLLGAIMTGSRIAVGLALVLGLLLCLLIYASIRWWIDGRRLGAWAADNIRFAIVVTSDSPKWAEYIKKNWLARFGDDVIVLNYSRRHEWAQSVVSEWIERVDPYTVSCPVVLVPRKNTSAAIYRFHNAFISAAHGDNEPLARMEERMFADYSEWKKIN